jgi:hypothetical protein
MQFIESYIFNSFYEIQTPIGTNWNGIFPGMHRHKLE